MSKRYRRMLSITLIIILIFQQSYEVLAKSNISEGITNLTSIGISKFNFSNIIKNSNNTNKEDKIKEEENKKLLEDISELKAQEKKREATNEEYTKLQEPVITLVRSVNEKTNIITWSGMSNSKYEIEIDDKVIDVNSNRTYIHRNLKPGSEHTYRVRLKNDKGKSEWSKKATVKTLDKRNKSNNILDNITKSNEITSRASTNFSFTEEYTHAHLTTSVHIINRGWLETEDDEVSGDVGDTVDQIKIKLNNVAYGVKIKYRAYVEGIGWQPWVYDGSIVGVSGKQIQAIEAKIVQVIEGNVEKDAEGVSIQYVLYCADFSNVNTISRNGETSGIIGKSASAFWASLINSDEYIKEVISKDTKWTLAGSPYVIKGELIINQGVRLEIDPGVKVIFQKYASRTNGVEVNGKLAVNGTATSPVLFTYSEDGKLVTQDRYSYKGIKITPTGELVGNNINIEFKGESFSHITNNGKLDLNNSKVTTINGAAGNYSTGILVQSEVNTLVQNSIITNCINGCLLRDSGGVIQLQGNKITKSIFGISIVNSFVSNSGQININNNELSDNGSGIEVVNKESKINKISIEGNRILRSKYSGIKYYGDDITNVTIIKNTITETDSARQYSGGGPIYIELNGLRTSSGVNFNNINPKDISLKNNLTNNNYDSVVISGTLSENLFLSKGLSNYLIDTHLIIPENVTLDIEPGTVINIRGYIQVNGKLNAEGKSLSPIIFTSINDSTNGVTHKPTTGYNVYRDNNFESIYVSEKGEFRGVNTRVRNGGRNFQDGVEYYPSNLKVWGSLTLINSEVGNSLTDGIFGTGNLIIINTKLYDCINYGVFTTGNLTLTNSKLVKNKRGLTLASIKVAPSIISNSFIENSEYGIFNASNITVDAAYNYWGSQYGPSFYDLDNSQMIKNGDEVGRNINFKPYLGAEYNSNLGDDFNKYINSLEYRNEKHFGLEGTNSATGNFSKSYQDLEAKFGDLNIKLTRTYNSLDNKDSIMGKGWRFGFQGEISDYTNEAGLKSKIIKLPNGSAQSFRQNSDGTYTANDSRNKLVKQSDNTFVLTTKEQNKYCFSNGKLVWIKDKNDNTISIEFNLEGKIFKITDYTGRIFTINYANGLLTNITETINGVAGRNINYSYLNSLLSKAEDSMGNITIYEYDTNKQLNKIKDKNGNILESVIYIQEGDSKGKVKEHKDIFGNNHIYNYDYLNNRTLITDSNNKTTEQWYDNEKFITFTVYPDRTISFIEYFLEDGINKYGEIKSEVNRNKVTNNYERDSNGNIIKIVNSDLSHKSFSYDENNNLVRESDENGHFTFYIYDSKKRNLIKKVQPIDGISEYKEGVDDSKYAITKYEYYSEEETIQQGYKIKALLKKVIDAEGNSITNTYDSSGNILSVTNQEGKVTTFQYDNLGNMKNEISPNKYITQFVHDKNGNLEKKVMHGGETTRIIYDSLGRKVKEISGKLYNSSLDDLSNHSYSGDHGSRSSYLLNGKIEWIKDAENNLTKYNYDLYGNVKTEIKPNGAIYIYEYDDMNRLTKIYFKENASLSQILLEENEYIIISDGATQKINKKYANDNENIITYSTYDYNNRLIEQKNADNTVVKIKYNPNGTKNSETDENGNTTYFEYDGLNRLINQLVPFEDTSGIKKYTYSYLDYDKNGNKVVEKTGKHGVEKDKLPESYITVNYSYYKDGKIKSTIDNEGRKNEYFYDDDGYLSSEHNYLAADKKIITNFTNNYLGKPITKTQYIQSCDLYGNELNDLRETQLVTTYTYDKNGNLETITTPSVKTSSNYTHPSITTTYTYDNLNRKTGESQPGKDEYGNDTIIKNTMEYNWEGNKSKNTDPLNRITQYIYNQRGWIDKVIDAKGGVTAYYYDRIGRKIAEVSPKNYDTSKNLSQMERTEITYDPMGRVKTIVNKFNSKEVNQTTYQWIDKWVEVVFKAYKYDGKGNIIKELDALGYESGTGTIADDKINSGFGTEYTYNLANKLITKLDPVSKEKNLQYTTKFDYDALGRKISEINGKGIITINEYDDAGNIRKVKIKKGINEPEQILQTKKYDFQNRLIQLVDSKNNAITYEYNTFNKIKKEVHPGDDTISENVISYQYSASGDLIKKKNSEGITNIYSYDNQGRVLSETISKDTSDEPNNIIIKSAYDKVGNKRFEYDGNGNVKENAFDEINRIKTSKVTVTNIEGVKSNQVTTFDYDKNGNEISVTDWRNNTYSKSYDGINRLVEKRDPYAIIQKLEYNHNNVQIKSYDALNNLTEYNYDKDNRLIATIDPERNRITQSYGSDGNIEWKADGKNNKTVYEYNELNKLSKVINAKYETTLYSYDLNGNLLTQVDGKGNTTSYEYNVANNVIRRIDHGGRTRNEGSFTYKLEKVESYTYYSDGSRKSKTDRNGNIIHYKYNALGKPISEVVGNISIAYTYDKNGNQLSISDDTGTTTRSYDELNRVVKKTIPKIGETKFKYDIIITRSDMPQASYAEKSIDPKGNITTKVFDKAGRIKYVVDGDTNATISATYDYYNNGSTKSLVYETGTREDYTYYSDNTLKSLINKKADGSVIESFSYEYDAANNQTKKTDRKGTTIYTYDELNRLDTVFEPSGKETKYVYDKAGNREIQAIKQNGNLVLTITYDYNEQNRLIHTTTIYNSTSGTVPYAYNNNANLTPIEPILVDEGIIYTYDNNGNLINKRKTVLNSEDTKNNALFAPVIGERLEGLSKDSVLNEYDSLNRLIKSTADGKTNTYEYNGENIRVSKSVNGENRRYLYEGDKIILEVDENGSQKARNIYGTNIISRKVESSSDKYYYLFNGHGDVTNLTGSDSKILATYYYDAFGVPTETTGNVDNPIRYASYQYDKETGNYYLMSRMYDPVIARFLQEDTYRGELNDPLSLNLYTYTHNNPITYDDPDGHWIHIAIGAAIGAAINVGITAYLDYKDDHKFNSGWREYAGAAVEGAITGSIGAATGGASLFTMITAEVASGFVGSAARQYISNGKVSLKKSATDAAFNGITFIGGHYAGKALSPVKKAIAQSKVVTKTKGLVLDGLSSKSDTILSLNKKIGESVQNVFEKINLPTQNKLAFSSAGGGGRSGIEATFDYVDESVMKNFNKVYSSETLQSTVKNIDNNISSSIKGAAEASELAKPGEDLYVGTYSKSRYANIKSGLNETHTPHHAVQDAISETTHGKGITINIRKDLHELTGTFRKTRDIDPTDLRTNLAADVSELRNILKDAGYDRNTINRQLQELIRQNKATGDFLK